MAGKKTFNFKLNEKVLLTESKEKGSVLGRAHYVNSDPSYLVRYVAADGRQCENWIPEDGLKTAGYAPE